MSCRSLQRNHNEMIFIIVFQHSGCGWRPQTLDNINAHTKRFQTFSCTTVVQHLISRQNIKKISRCTTKYMQVRFDVRKHRSIVQGEMDTRLKGDDHQRQQAFTQGYLGAMNTCPSDSKLFGSSDSKSATEMGRLSRKSNGQSSRELWLNSSCSSGAGTQKGVYHSNTGISQYGAFKINLNYEWLL